MVNLIRRIYPWGGFVRVPWNPFIFSFEKYIFESKDPWR